MGSHANLANDGNDLSILVDHNRLARRKSSSSRKHAIRFGNIVVGIAQNGIIEFERFCEFFVGFGCVTTGSKIGDFEFLEIMTALTERFTFQSSATGERFGEPGNDDRFFPFEVFEFVGFSVASGKFESRSLIANFQIGSRDLTAFIHCAEDE